MKTAFKSLRFGSVLYGSSLRNSKSQRKFPFSVLMLFLQSCFSILSTRIRFQRNALSKVFAFKIFCFGDRSQKFVFSKLSTLETATKSCVFKIVCFGDRSQRLRVQNVSL